MFIILGYPDRNNGFIFVQQYPGCSAGLRGKETRSQDDSFILFHNNDAELSYTYL